MPKINPRIKSIDDLLGVTQATETGPEAASKPAPDESNEIQMLPPQIIRSFRGSPFREYGGERFDDLVDSVSEHGVLNPTIIRKIERDEDGFEYEMLAGRQTPAESRNHCKPKSSLYHQDRFVR